MLSVKSDSPAQRSSLPPLRKYYLNVASDCKVYADDGGALFSDLAAAHRGAVSLIWNCMRSDTEEHWKGWHVKIADDTGRTLVIVLFPTAWSRTFDPHGASE